MGIMDAVFGEDIVLDEAAFDKAISEFSALSTEVQKLRSRIETMLANLQKGFDTPAGRKFVSSCEKNLSQPLEAQQLALEHISRTLSESRQSYEAVFEEYEALQTQIKQIK